MTIRAIHRGALVGFGSVAENAHLPAFASFKTLKIVAVTDPSPERLKQARKLLPRARGYKDLTSLFKKEKIDFIDIASPPAFHARQTIQGLKAGVHVLCEKPLALSLQEFQEIETAMAEKQRIAFCVHNWKHAPQMAAAKKLVKKIGPIRFIETRVLRTKPSVSAGDDWRTKQHMAGGGILIDHGWHNLYLLKMFLNQTPHRIYSRLSGNPLEHTANIGLAYDNAHAALYFTWQAARRENRMNISGIQGELELRDDKLIIKPKKGKTEELSFPEKLSSGSAHPKWFKKTLEDFSCAIKDPATARQNLEEARFCLTTICTAYKSSRETLPDSTPQQNLPASQKKPNSGKQLTPSS